VLDLKRNFEQKNENLIFLRRVLYLPLWKLFCWIIGPLMYANAVADVDAVQMTMMCIMYW